MHQRIPMGTQIIVTLKSMDTVHLLPTQVRLQNLLLPLLLSALRESHGDRVLSMLNIIWKTIKDALIEG
jgi:hypothetical protein